MHASRWGSVCLAAGLAVAASSRSAFAGTGREQEAFADEALVRMKDNATALRSQLQSSQDVGRTQCLHGKLAQLEMVKRQAEDARSTLRRASLREDMDAMALASATLTRLDGRARELRGEAEQCGRGETQATFQDDPIAGAQTVSADLRATPQSDESISFLSAPAASPQDSRSPAAPASSTPAPSPQFAPNSPAPAGSPYAVDSAHEASMLAYSADFTLAVFQVDKSLASVETLARQLGGYLAQRGDAQITVRVPRPRFDDAVARLEKLGDVLHRNVAAEDVTDEFVDLELRLKNARAMRERLAMLLKGASVKDAVEIEKELAKVTEVVEQIEGRLKVLRDKVGYSSITVSFQANAATPVRSAAILPFTWLDTMGLEPLLNVPTVSP